MIINTTNLPSKGFNTTVSSIQIRPLTYGEILNYKRSDAGDSVLSELLFWSRKYPEITEVSSYDIYALLTILKYNSIPDDSELELTFTNGESKMIPMSSIEFIEITDEIKRVCKLGDYQLHISTIGEILNVKYNQSSIEVDINDLLMASNLGFKSVEEYFNLDAKYYSTLSDLKYKLIGNPYVEIGGEEILIPLEKISSLFRSSIYTSRGSDVKVEYTQESQS